MVYCCKDDAISTKLTFFMAMEMSGRNKIFNDPVYGFIRVPDKLHFEVIEHPYFQRLRRIKQMGLTYLVYPGAHHGRFQHSIGAMHLMQIALETLNRKGHHIPRNERQAASLAILLHDIGHGPYSHALEETIVSGLGHEELTLLLMHQINNQFGGALDEAIAVFEGTHPKKFLCELVSSQLDMDRMDYLKRDSFFTGVKEGNINSDRLLAMLQLSNNHLVIEAKGIHSVEHFLVARQLMYWQVYLHKTSLSAEFMLVNCLRRAKQLSMNGHQLAATPALQWFLQNNPQPSDFYPGSEAMEKFTQLDDYDVFTALKLWQNDSDRVLRLLSRNIVNRRLFKIEVSKEAFASGTAEALLQGIRDTFELNADEAAFFLVNESTSKTLYNPDEPPLHILSKDGSLADIRQVSDQFNFTLMDQPVTRHYLCYPKEVRGEMR